MHALVHAADVQDRDGGVVVMATLFGLYPFLLKLYADGGYQGPQFQEGLRRVCRRIRVEIVKRSDQAKGFAVLPKRWIVERTIAWLNRCRRLAKDWECLSRKALAFLHLASIRLMLRKLSHTQQNDPGRALILQLSLRTGFALMPLPVTVLGHGLMDAPPERPAEEMIEHYAGGTLQAANELADLAHAEGDQRSRLRRPLLCHVTALSFTRMAARKAKASMASVTCRYQPCRERIS